MTVDRSLQSFFERVSDERAPRSPAAVSLLPPGGGGGTSGGMEARLAKLEADMDHAKRDLSEIRIEARAIRADVGAIRTSVGVLDEKLKHVATIPQMWMASIGIVAALGGIVALIVRFIPHV